MCKLKTKTGDFDTFCRKYEVTPKERALLAVRLAGLRMLLTLRSLGVIS